MLNGLAHLWINRHVDIERRVQIESYFSDGGVDHIRVEAITPETLPHIRVRQPFTNSMSELAIIASHLDAIQKVHQAGHQYAVIMEDDVRSRYVFDANALISSAPADWEILQLHVSNGPVVLQLGEMYLRHAMLWHEWEPTCFSAGAYLISRKGAERILSQYRPTGKNIDLTGVYSFGKLVADHLLYRRVCCYTATVPFFFNDVRFISTHAPDRDDTHHRPGARAVEQLMQRIADQSMAQADSASDLRKVAYPFAVRAVAPALAKV